MKSSIMLKERVFKLSPRFGGVTDVKDTLSFEDFVKEVYTKDKGFHDMYDFQFEMAHWFLNQEGTSLLLATRGIGKTLILTALTSLYRIYKDPKCSIIIISYKAKASETIISYITSIIKTNPTFFKDIIDIKALKVQSIKTRQFRGKGSNITTSSLDSSIRGNHVDYIIFDDLINEESSSSEAFREKTKRYYEESQKISPNIQFVGNITHPQDLHSELRLKDSIPKFEIYANDDRLPDEFRPDVEKERENGVSEASIQKNYYGKLLPDETLPFYNVRVISDDGELNTKHSTPYVFYDFSQGRKDLSCFSLCWQVGYKIYVYGYAKKQDWSSFVNETAHIVKDFKHVYFESNTSGLDMGIRAFEHNGIKAIGKPTTTNKVSKIQALYPLRDSLILVNDGSLENKAYIEQFQGYSPKSGNSDDSVDSLAMCLIQMNIINTK